VSYFFRSILAIMLLLITPCSPVFVVANVLVVSSPPALTLAQARISFRGIRCPISADIHRFASQLTQVASGDAFERLISRTLFWSYCIITPPATIVYVVVGLILAKL
jgi:auxin efflux carrier family protein